MFCNDASYMYVYGACLLYMSVVITVCCVTAIVENSGFLRLGVLKYVVCLCRVCD